MRLRDAAVLIDQVCDALRILVLWRLGSSVCHSDLVIGVAEQRKRKTLLLREFAIFLDGVEAGAQNLDVFGFVVFDEIAELATFRRSTRCAGLGKEPQDDFLSAKVAELHATAAVIGRLEIGSGIADFQHCWTSSKRAGEMADDSAD